jgi:hypothetical protein
VDHGRRPVRERTSTRAFHADNGVGPYLGSTDDSQWNGWLNVRVEPAVRGEIVRDLEADATISGYPSEDAVGGIDELAVADDGLVSGGPRGRLRTRACRHRLTTI